MRTQLTVVWTLVFIGFRFAPFGTAVGREERAATAVLYQGKLIGLDTKGQFSVWNVADGRFDEDTSSKLSRQPVTHIATDGDKLWAAGNSALYSWSLDQKSWAKASDFKQERSELTALACVGTSPLLIFPTKIRDQIANRTYPMPTLHGQVQWETLRVLALHTTPSRLWVGTGYGEWGGHLLGLDLRTGAWAQYCDDLHYVTGITQAKPDELIVSWAMSHFGAHTLVRVHRIDATPSKSYPMLNSRYYQRISYSAYDKTLYGIENTDVVSITDGKPSKICQLEGRLFEREPNAIGVSPGIAALLPVARKTLIVVPGHGLPWKLNDATLTRLSRP